MSYTKLINSTQPINLGLGEMATYRDNVKELFTDTAKGSSMCMRLFRVHRGGLDDSLSTAIYCKDGLKSIKEYVIDESIFLPPKSNAFTELLHINNKPIIDSRLPEWWGSIEFEVYMSHPAYGKVIIGYSNFSEEFKSLNINAMEKELEKSVEGTEKNEREIPEITTLNDTPDIIIGVKVENKQSK